LAADGEAANIVENARAGIAVPPGDAAAIAGALRQLVVDPAARRSAGKSGRSAACENYNRIDIAERFIRHLSDKLKRFSPNPPI